MKSYVTIKKMLVLSLTISVTTACFTGCGKSGGDDAAAAVSTASSADGTVAAVSGTSAADTSDSIFPYQLEDGKLAVNSFFTSDIDNPDSGNETGENIASIELVNQSGECLIDGTFTVTTADGREIPFEITYLPAGEKAWLFAADNSTVEDLTITSITDTAEFNSEDLLMADSFAASSEDTTVTLTNNSGADQSNILVYCHSKMDDTIFGGIIYTYTVDYLSAGETTTIDAADCWLGTAEVERVSVGEY